jgi:hypothetical protein
MHSSWASGTSRTISRTRTGLEFEDASTCREYCRCSLCRLSKVALPERQVGWISAPFHSRGSSRRFTRNSHRRQLKPAMHRHRRRGCSRQQAASSAFGVDLEGHRQRRQQISNSGVTTGAQLLGTAACAPARHRSAKVVGLHVAHVAPKSKGLAEAKPLNLLVEMRRIELLTFALRTRRSPS